MKFELQNIQQKEIFIPPPPNPEEILNRKKWMDWRNQTFKNLYDQGVPTLQIAKAFGYSNTAIWEIIELKVKRK